MVAQALKARKGGRAASEEGDPQDSEPDADPQDSEPDADPPIAKKLTQQEIKKAATAAKKQKEKEEKGAAASKKSLVKATAPAAKKARVNRERQSRSSSQSPVKVAAPPRATARSRATAPSKRGAAAPAAGAPAAKKSRREVGYLSPDEEDEPDEQPVQEEEPEEEEEESAEKVEEPLPDHYDALNAAGEEIIKLPATAPLAFGELTPSVECFEVTLAAYTKYINLVVLFVSQNPQELPKGRTMAESMQAKLAAAALSEELLSSFPSAQQQNPVTQQWALDTTLQDVKILRLRQERVQAQMSDEYKHAVLPIEKLVLRPMQVARQFTQAKVSQ
jgi:hypothetical protein